jgi:hypothetical protein
LTNEFPTQRSRDPGCKTSATGRLRLPAASPAGGVRGPPRARESTTVPGILAGRRTATPTLFGDRWVGRAHRRSGFSSRAGRVDRRQVGLACRPSPRHL